MIKQAALTSIILLLSTFAGADIYVVANRDNPTEELAVQQVRDLYLARLRAFEDGSAVRVYDREDNRLRQRFLDALVGMNPRQFDAYWARLVFAGRVLPLGKAEPDEKLLLIVAEDINAIGYVDQPPASEKIKTLLIIND